MLKRTREEECGRQGPRSGDNSVVFGKNPLSWLLLIHVRGELHLMHKNSSPRGRSLPPSSSESGGSPSCLSHQNNEPPPPGCTGARDPHRGPWESQGSGWEETQGIFFFPEKGPDHPARARGLLWSTEGGLEGRQGLRPRRRGNIVGG